MLSPVRTETPVHPGTQRQEEECLLRVTKKPICGSSPWLARFNELVSRDDGMTTYYVCGRCNIIMGLTPTMVVLPGMVLRCVNCGAHNELPL